MNNKEHNKQIAKELTKQIADRVRQLRIQNGLTTTDLSKLLGISQAQVSRLENAKQGFRGGVIARLGEALGVQPDHFIIQEQVLADAMVDEGFREAVVKLAEKFKFKTSTYRLIVNQLTE